MHSYWCLQSFDVQWVTVSSVYLSVLGEAIPMRCAFVKHNSLCVKCCGYKVHTDVVKGTSYWVTCVLSNLLGFTTYNLFVACRTPDAPVPAWGDDGNAEDSSDSESSFSD